MTASRDLSSDEKALIQQHLDGALADTEIDRLRDLLKESCEARAFLRSMATLDSGLHELFASVSTVDIACSDAAASSPATSLRLRRVRTVGVLAAMAACLLAIVGATIFLGGNNADNDDTIATSDDAAEKVVARVAQISDVQWNGDVWSVGTAIASRRLSIASGIIRLEFADGVEVTLQGPADYEILSIGHTRLNYGLLTATVSDGAEGFTVETPSVDIVDLGTAFGIDLDENGLAEISVFDGEVEVSPDGATNSTRVHEGEAIQVAADQLLEAAKFDLSKYEKIWPVASGIVNSTGAFQFAPPWPRRMGAVQSDSDIFVLPEGYAQTLEKPLQVNVSEPGECRVSSDLTHQQIEAGSRIKCYLLQFKPVDSGGRAVRDKETRPDPSELKRIIGEITFDRPVLGLIVRGEDLRASDALFSKRGGQVPQKGRSLELFGSPRDDTVTLSEDRRTVTLNLAAFGIFSDQVRVIVDQSLEDQR